MSYSAACPSAPATAATPRLGKRRAEQQATPQHRSSNVSVDEDEYDHVHYQAAKRQAVAPASNNGQSSAWWTRAVRSPLQPLQPSPAPATTPGRLGVSSISGADITIQPGTACKRLGSSGLQGVKKANSRQQATRFSAGLHGRSQQQQQSWHWGTQSGMTRPKPGSSSGYLAVPKRWFELDEEAGSGQQYDELVQVQGDEAGPAASAGAFSFNRSFGPAGGAGGSSGETEAAAAAGTVTPPPKQASAPG